jgi:hypothetical protein
MIGEGDEVAFEGFGALLRLAQLEAGAADDDFAPMLDVAVDERLEREFWDGRDRWRASLTAKLLSSAVCL